MDLSFNNRMEAYYQKFIDLQEKLRNSEEERLKLEMKFNQMVQVAKEEEQLHYKKLRSQYKRFLEEDRKRQERNERIIRTLERIEARIGMLASKTDRFRMLRRQYQSYLQRISRFKSSENPKENPPPPQIVKDIPKASNINKDLIDRDLNISLDQTNDEKLEILDKYLKNLSSQKSMSVANGCEKNQYSDLKYLDDFSKKIDKGFDSNQANSIAEDIMNSIYSRHYKKESAIDDSLKVNKFTTPNHVNNNRKAEKFSDVGDYNRNSFNTIKSNYSASYNLGNDFTGRYSEADIKSTKDLSESGSMNFNNGRDSGLTYFNDNVPYTETKLTGKKNPIRKDELSNVHKRTASKNILEDNFNKSATVCSPSSFMNDSNNERDSFNSTFGPGKYISQEPLGTYGDENKTKVMESVFTSDKLPVISLNDKMKSKEDNLFKDGEQDKSSNVKIDHSDKLSLSKAEIDVNENEKYSASELDIKEQGDDVDEFISKDNKEPTKQTEAMEEVRRDKEEENQEAVNNINEIINSKHEDEAIMEHEKVSEQITSPHISDNKSHEDDTDSHLTIISEITIPQREEAQFTTNKIENESQEEDGGSIQLAEEQVNKEVTFHSSHNDDESQDNVTTNLNEYNQDMQYNQYSQAIANEQYSNEIVYDESGGMIESQYEDIHYDERNQPPNHGLYYDGNAKEQSNENGEGIQQYGGSEQTNVYDQQYISNQVGEFYDEGGQVSQQYDENVINPYEQQYDENGQPLYQYDENGQIIPQYDENGQPIDIYNQQLQYDENGQPILQHDENGQSAGLYAENQQSSQGYEQPFQQYDTSGQEFQQYDENGQSVYQYDNGDTVPQYDQNGQQLIQHEQTDQVNQEYKETDGQYQHYDESTQQLQFEGSNETTPQHENDYDVQVEEKENIENNQDVDDGHLEQTSKLNESPTESSKNDTPGDGKSDDVEDVKIPQKGKNVLDMLDTDTESLKQNTSKTSNDSDFDFSNNK